jgi:hypothetical protein
MAIAPLPDWEDLDALTKTRPPLRLLSSPGESSRAVDPGPGGPENGRRPPTCRTWSEGRRRRLRRTGLAVLFLGLLGGLAIPVSALAGTSGPTLAPGEIYTVHPGDTLASIALRLDPSAAQEARLVGEMSAQTGSRTVVVGERIVLP